MKPMPAVVAEVAVQVVLIASASVGIALADVTISEGAVTGGIAGTIIVVGGALVNWYLRVRKDAAENRKAKVEVDQEAEDRQAARERKVRKDALDEWRQTVTDLRNDRDLDRQEIHALRDIVQAEKLEHALTKRRLDECERDRREITDRVDALERRPNGGE